jgi:hypothetical protein
MGTFSDDLDLGKQYLSRARTRGTRQDGQARETLASNDLRDPSTHRKQCPIGCARGYELDERGKHLAQVLQKWRGAVSLLRIVLNPMVRMQLGTGMQHLRMAKFTHAHADQRRAKKYHCKKDADSRTQALL